MDESSGESVWGRNRGHEPGAVADKVDGCSAKSTWHDRHPDHARAGRFEGGARLAWTRIDACLQCSSRRRGKGSHVERVDRICGPQYGRRIHAFRHGVLIAHGVALCAAWRDDAREVARSEAATAVSRLSSDVGVVTGCAGIVDGKGEGAGHEGGPEHGRGAGEDRKDPEAEDPGEGCGLRLRQLELNAPDRVVP